MDTYGEAMDNSLIQDQEIENEEDAMGVPI
jgi:hypothetical protein